jgi:hypothetical protein
LWLFVVNNTVEVFKKAAAEIKLPNPYKALLLAPQC